MEEKISQDTICNWLGKREFEKEYLLMTISKLEEENKGFKAKIKELEEVENKA